MWIDVSLARDIKPLFVRVAVVLQPSSCLFVMNILSSVQQFNLPGDASTNSMNQSVAKKKRGDEQAMEIEQNT